MGALIDVGAFHEGVAAFVRGARRPGTTIVGVSGPQGCGKSTLAEAVVGRLVADGLRAVALSIDDVYLTRAEQEALAARFPGNRALAERGYPGTHDVALGAAVLDALGGVGRVAVPRYDKGAHGGRGDRAPEASWPIVEAPADVVLFEGWMLGFRPVPDALVPDPALRVPNARLADYAAWTDRLHAFVHLDPADPAWFVDWRVEAERARRARGPALSDADARAYAEAFAPAYALWGPGLRAHPPARGPHVRYVLGRDRLPISEPRAP